MKDSINYSGFLDIVYDSNGEETSKDSKPSPALNESPSRASIGEASIRRPSMNDLDINKSFWTPD